MRGHVSSLLVILNSLLDGDHHAPHQDHRLFALAVCLLGYGGFALTMVLRKLDLLETSQVLMIGVPSALIGEIGLWVAAGALGWSIFKGP